MKDLVSVLAKQNDKFKKKFFECLMVKLWDTNLPLIEYLQLNRLMKALFGESYHKLDLKSPSTRSRKSSKIEYLTFSETKNSKTDAEHIVNLMRTYLDAQSPKKQAEYIQTKLMQNDEDIDETNFITVSSLLDSLRVRQKVDDNAESKRYKSLLDLNSTSKYKSELFDSNEFSFKNGFNGLQNQELSPHIPLKNGNQDVNSYEKYLDAYIDSVVKNTNEPTNSGVSKLKEKIESLEKCVNPLSSHAKSHDKTIKRSELIAEKIKNFDEKPADLTSSRFSLHPPLSTSTIKSSGIIASFQPTSNQCKDSDENTRWATSLVKNIFITNNSNRENDYDETVYKEFSTYSPLMKRGMHSQTSPREDPFARERSVSQKEMKSSEKIKNLLDIFKNLNDSSNSVDAVVHHKTTQRKAKKLNSCFSDDVKRSSASSVSKNKDTSIFVPSNYESGKVRARLENWNSITDTQAKKIGVNYKVKCHQKISDLIAEKIYKFEKKDMLQAYY